MTEVLDNTRIYISGKNEEKELQTVYTFSALKIVIAVKFIVIAVHATSNTMNNIMNGDMFYNLEFEIHLLFLLLLMLLIWFCYI